MQKALIGLQVRTLTGDEAELLPNHHIAKTVLLGTLCRRA
jgi:hypothetical protein